MRGIFQSFPLKLRLATWFASACLMIILGLVPLVYLLIQRQLYIDLDQQLRVDWDLIVTHLETDSNGDIRWRASSPATPDSPGYVGTSFDVWVRNQRILDHVSIFHPPISPPAPGIADNTPRHDTLELGEQRRARIFQRSCLIDGREVTLRVYRNLARLQQTLKRISTGFFLGAPLAALLAALGGYFISGRALQPIGAMAEQAQQITSESLSQRLPNLNPHDELGQLACVINATLDRLEKSFNSLKRFTADASHELRTPLTALRTIGEVALRESPNAESLRETISSMLEETQRLNHLIDSLLTLARTDANDTPIQLSEVNVSKTINAVCEQLEVLASEKRQTLKVDVDPGIQALAESTLLHQVLFNLLNNAICYSYEETEIQVVANYFEGFVTVDLMDHGPGIAPEHQEEVFERFYRIDKARSRERGGFGLGLAIVKLLVERMGGQIQLESQPGCGSRFRVLLPAA